MSFMSEWVQQIAGANRRWRCLFRCRGSRRESAVAQLTLAVITPHEFITDLCLCGC